MSTCNAEIKLDEDNVSERATPTLYPGFNTLLIRCSEPVINVTCPSL